MTAATTNATNNANTTMSAIDRALAAAKARKAARDAMYTEIAAADPKMSKAKQVKVMKAEILDNLNDVDPRTKAKKSEQPAAAKARKAAANVELSEIQRAEARSKRDAERVERLNAKAAKAAETAAKLEAAKAEAAAKKAQRAEERAAAKAAKLAEVAAKRADAKRVAHLRKVENARSKLPALDGPTTAAVVDLTTKFTAAQLEVLAQHLMVHARTERTVRSVAPGATMAVGDAVTVVGGAAKHVGAVGTLVVVNKLRVQVKVDGVTKPLYLYRADVAPVATAEAAQLDSPGA